MSDPNFHRFPEPKESVAGRWNVFPANHSLRRIAAMWRPAGSNLEPVVATLCRFAHRIVSTTGDAYTAEQLEAKILSATATPPIATAQVNTVMSVSGSLNDGTDAVVFPDLVFARLVNGKPEYTENGIGTNEIGESAPKYYLRYTTQLLVGSYWSLTRVPSLGGGVWIGPVNGNEAGPELVSQWTANSPATGTPSVFPAAPVGGPAASGTIAFAAAPNNGATIVIGGVTYYLGTGTSPAFPTDVYPPFPTANATTWAEALAARINNWIPVGGAVIGGTDPNVSAVAAAGVVTLTSKYAGLSGNSITLTKSATNVTVSGSTLTGGSGGLATAATHLGQTVIVAETDVYTCVRVSPVKWAKLTP